MNRALVLTSLMCVALVVFDGPVAADGGGAADATTSGQSIIAAGQQANDAEAGNDSENTTSATAEVADTAGAPLTWTQQPACDTVGASGCLQAYRCPDGSPAITWEGRDKDGVLRAVDTQCPGESPPTGAAPTTPVDIPGAVLRAFERVDLPKSTINVQPPGGETLVNLPTILSTSAERHQIAVRLNEVNLDITLEVWPTSFVWHHGDGTSQETTTPGKPWTEGADTADLITHTYAKTSEGLDLSVDTTWSAQFQIAGQPGWRPVDGTVTITGTPVTVAVLEAKPQLVR